MARNNSFSTFSHTYSIVAYDALHKQLGVAIQTHSFGVGSSVPWIEPGVGAIVTQAWSEISYGPVGLSLMRLGKSATSALDALLTTDSRPDMRQIAMVDINGDVAVHTGERCVDFAGNYIGKAFSTQGNFLLKDNIWLSMAQDFEKKNGDLADKLLSALQAAEQCGGDARGARSAALIVAPAEKTALPWERSFDLRVEDSLTPINELQRLLNIAKSKKYWDKAVDTLYDFPGDKEKLELARDSYQKAISLLPSPNPEYPLIYAMALTYAGHTDVSFPLFTELFRSNPEYRALIPRLAARDFFPDDPAVIANIMRL